MQAHKQNQTYPKPKTNVMFLTWTSPSFTFKVLNVTFVAFVQIDKEK